MTSDTPAASVAKIIIVAELRSKPSAPFEAALAAMGTSYRLANNVWFLRAATTVGAVRNNLNPHMGPRDSFFAVDTTSGRTAWVNLGPEADARIRAIFQSEGKA